MRDSSNALLGYFMSFGNNGGTVYVAESVGALKFPIPRSMATGAIVQTIVYYTGAGCTGSRYVLPTDVGPGAYFVDGNRVCRAGATPTGPWPVTLVSYFNAAGTSCVTTSFQAMALSATPLTSGGLFAASTGPLILVYP